MKVLIKNNMHKNQDKSHMQDETLAMYMRLWDQTPAEMTTDCWISLFIYLFIFD